jgi:outer membrane protein OmpA-like peptidoglycan-associated protein
MSDRSVTVLAGGGRPSVTLGSSLSQSEAVGTQAPGFAVPLVDGWCDDATSGPDMLRMYEELSGARVRPFTTATQRELVKPFLRQAFERGDLVVLDPSRGMQKAPETNAAAGERKKPEPEPERPPPTRRQLAAPKQLHQFGIRLVDELGGPITGVTMSFVHGGAKEDVSTDGNGVARLEDSAATSATAAIADSKALRKALKPIWDQPRGERAWLDEAQGATVVSIISKALPSFDLQADKVRIVTIQPYVARVRLIGGFFDTNKCFVLPRGLDAIRAVVAMYGEHPKAKLLLVGHTDAAGKPAYNDKVSLERAEATLAYLTDDVGAWYAWYETSKPEEKRWGSKEDAGMIAAMPDFGSRDPSEEPVRWYQRTRGLTVDGIAGSQTRHKLIAEYMALDGTSLPKGIEGVCHGCGENFPDKPTEHSEAAEDDRRVEAFFFDGDLGVQPPPPGKNSQPGSTVYPEWVRRAKRTEDHVIKAGQVWFRLMRVTDDKPAVGLLAVIALPDGTTIRHKADDEGYIRLDGMTGEQFRLLEVVDDTGYHGIIGADDATPIAKQ